nr:MAG: hypothetical protein [Caudoviricetes sp.]
MEDYSLQRFVGVVLIVTLSFISYNIGKQSTITKVLNLIEQEENVTNQTVILEDLRIDISKLR